MTTNSDDTFLARPALMADMARLGVVFAPEDEEHGGGDETLDEAPDEDFEGQHAGEHGDEDDGEDDAGFLENLTKGSEEAPEADTKVTDPKPTEPPKDVPATLADDAHEVEVQIDGKPQRFKVADLKKFAGFDAVLGAKTKEVAERETGAKTRLETAERVIKGALEAASKNWDLYKNIDFLALAKRPDVTAEALTNLRNEAQAAWEHFDFLNKSAADVAKTVERASAEDRNRAAVEGLRDLEATFPKALGEKFTKEVYGEIVAFAKEHGIDDFHEVVDPRVIRLMRMAQKYAAGRVLSAAKVTNVAKPVSKPMRSGGSDTSGARGERKLGDALARLKKSGSDEDAEDAFMATFRRAD